MINTYNKESLIETYRKKTLDKLIKIKNNMLIRFIEIDTENEKELMEKRRSIEEIELYIYHIKNIRIDILDELAIIISKVYLVTQSLNNALDTLKYMGITKLRIDGKKEFEITESTIRAILKSAIYEEQYKYNKSFQFAKEIYYRSGKRQLNSNWKSMYYYKNS